MYNVCMYNCTWIHGSVTLQCRDIQHIIFVTMIWQYLDDMIITRNFNHDYHDYQNIAHP